MRDFDLCWCGSGAEYCFCHKELDLKLDDLRRHGKTVPPKKLIKNKRQIEGIREACRINSLILDKVASIVKEGITTQDIDDVVAEETTRLGGIPGPLGYEGYPKSVCTSVNDQVCHGIPSKKVVLKSGDIVNVDCTTKVNGFYWGRFQNVYDRRGYRTS